MAKLHQLIAIQKGVKQRHLESITAMHRQSDKPALFNGSSKYFRALGEGGEVLPPEKVQVQAEVMKNVAALKKTLVELYDTSSAIDEGNRQACADVVVNGQVVLSKVPSTTLLFLEKQLYDLLTWIQKLPVLDPAEAWSSDPTSGLFKTDETQTHRTRKVVKPIVKYDATKEHPAQTELITIDEISGYWYQTKFSGAIPTPLKEKWADNVDQLIKATRMARAEANEIEVRPPNFGAKLVDFVFSV